MKFLAFDIPETQAEAARWLEGHLVSLQLPDLVTELAAIHGPVSHTESVRAILGGALPLVLAYGLERAELEAHIFRRLLREPLLLLELQELVLTDGGPFWRALESHSGVVARVEENWRRLKTRLPHRADEPMPPPRAASWYARPWPWVLVVLAAGLGFGACFAWLRGWERSPQPLPQQPSQESLSAPWGWNKPNATAAAESPQAYLNRLADLVEEWKSVAPQPDAPDVEAKLMTRLAELRGGAARLQVAAHPLPTEKRQQLQTKAREWGKEIDKLIQLLPDITPKNLLPSIEQRVREMAEDLRAGRLDH